LDVPARICSARRSERWRCVTGHGECYITEIGLLKLIGRVERPLLENPGEQLLEDADEQAKRAVIRRALDGLRLTARDRRIIESYFGIGCEQRTLTQLASEQNVCFQFVQNRLNRGVAASARRQISRASIAPTSVPTCDAMGRADEARVRTAAEARRRALHSEEKRGSHPRVTHVSASVRVQVTRPAPRSGTTGSRTTLSRCASADICSVLKWGDSGMCERLAGLLTYREIRASLSSESLARDCEEYAITSTRNF